MKNRFTTLDLIGILPEIRERLIGMRVNQVYDVDAKTFIFRFSKTVAESTQTNRSSNSTTTAAATAESDEQLKQQLIIESGIRIHMTEFSWPKNDNPSGFTMKLRKHLRNKRLEAIEQVGVDRIIDMRFGANEYATHVIVELYSKGNVILADKDYTIMSLLRLFKDARTNVNIAVHERYPIAGACGSSQSSAYIVGDKRAPSLTRDRIERILAESKGENNFKKLFNPHFTYGPALLEHSMRQYFDRSIEISKLKVTTEHLDRLVSVFAFADRMVDEFRRKASSGFILRRMESPATDSSESRYTNEEFHPYLFAQFASMPPDQIARFDTFNQAVDRFFSSIEGQKIESKAMQAERQAMKKLEAIKRDHESRLDNLAAMQAIDNRRAQLIESNIELVDSAIGVLRSAIANKYSWDTIADMVRDAQDCGDLIACKIRELKLGKNSFSMILDDPYDGEDSTASTNTTTSMIVDIDIGLSAFANARKHYDHRKDAARKEQKTIDHSERAFKNVERKVKQQLKETTIKTNIVLARKVLWFEKFYWFISSEGFLVIAGRDAQQNEMIVKRYLAKHDLYVHADMHGATSVVIKNYRQREPQDSTAATKEDEDEEQILPPPKTINEAANMAICFSAAWDAKVVTAAYWVRAHQVQKIAPSGQYLSVGSFMIRGRKNYIPVQNLILGFGFRFRVDEQSWERRRQAAAASAAADAVIDDYSERAPSAPRNDTKITDDDNLEAKTAEAAKEEEENEENEQFPDTKISLIKSDQPDSGQPPAPVAADDKSEYTIVTTGEIKRKAKIITQKTLQKKTQQQTKNQKKAEKRQKQKEKLAAKRGGSERADSTVPRLTTTIEPVVEPSGNDHSKLDSKQQEIDEEIQKLHIINDSVGDDANGNEETEMKIDDDDNNNNEDGDEDEEDEEATGSRDLDPKGREFDALKLIESLVHNPSAEDHLLYAIPVCGPYMSMQAYKYKLKIIPGTTKRGRAAKTALEVFVRDKFATERERDLLKAIKDQDISKNMPGKVKIITSHANK